LQEKLTPTSEICQLSDLSDAFNDGLATPNNNKVEWVQKTGKLVFHLASTKTFNAGEEYVISVEKLLNSNEAQDSPDVTVKLTGEVEVATVPMEKGMDEMAPFYISPPKLLVAKIGQSSCTLGASNTLTISLESNIGIQAIGAGSAAKVTISGLTGFADADSNVAVTPASYYSTDGIFTSNQAAWKKNDGTLIMTLTSGKRLHAGRLYVFKVTLTNPTDARAATELVTISLASSNNLIVSKEAEMSSDIKKMVLTVCTAGWDTLRIGQSKTGASTTNTISVTMKPNIVLNAGVNTKISISGLTNSGTADSGTLAIAGCGDVATSGKWTKSSGMLEFSPAQAWPAGTEYVCTFDLQSPSEIQEAATVTIKVDSYSTGQITPVIATSTFRNAPGNKGPFKIIDATFETAKIGQTMPYPGVTDNVITVTLKSNKPIGSTNSVVSAITISGLTGSQTADSSTLAITSITAGLANIIGTTGDWNKEKGELIISVVNNQQLAADTEYKLSFKLQNPEDKQESPAVMVSVSGGSAIAKMPMKSDMKGCIHNEGDTAPLFVYGRTFLVKKIGYRTTTPQAANVVTITLTTSISLSYQSGSATKITVSGISGMSTADSSTLAITSTHPTDFGKTAEWNKMDGSLIFTIQNGGSLAAGTTQYVLSAALSNGPDVDSPSPKIVSSGLGQKIAIEDMDMTGHYYEAPSVSMSTAADAVTAVQITFPAHKAIAKGDTLVVSLPGAGGDSTDAGDQIWGVKSLPDVFSVEATKTAYNDAIAHGDDVAMARFRAGDAGTVAGVSSENDGIKGSTMKLHKSNRDVFGHANVYAGQKLSIGGSDVEHLIVRQVAASTGADSSVDGHPAVAHFFPKYPGVAADDNVPAGTKYTIAAQLEFFAKAAVCEGTLISITVPASAGIKVPSNWASGAASVSLIRAGIPQAMQIGAATDAIEADVFVGATGREVSMQLDDATTADLHGYNFFPVQTVANDFTEIDGYRHIISNTDETYKVMTGYGPKKSSAVKEDAAAVALKQATPITDTNVNVGDKVWITLGAAVDAAVKPPSSKGSFGNNPVTGSFVQLLTTEEIMRYTGRSGKRVDSIAVPATSPGVACAKGGVNCAGVGCMTVTFSGTGNLNPCLQFPTADVTFTGGAISSFTMIDGGACTATQLQATLVKAEGVTCTTEPSGDTAATLAAASPVYEFERMQLGTSAGEVASCTFAAPCTAAKLVATDLHVDEGKLALDLLYTKSPKELAYANKQKLRINDATVVTTVAAGDYITTMSAPQEKGLCTKPDGGKCTGNDACVTVAVTGCAVNPAVTIEWEAAGVNAGKIKTMALRSGFDGVCESAADATVTFTVNDGYSCATMPACGNGCAATADTAKDIIHVLRPANNDGALSANQKILRVHDAQGTGSKYGVVLMPETPAKVIDLGVEGIIPAVMCVEMMPQAGKTYGFWSSVSFKMIVKVTANGDVPSLNVCDRPTDANFPMATYPAECATTGCAISPTGLSNSTRAQRRDLTTEYIASESFNLYIGGNNISGNASLKVDVPLVFNVNGSIPSRRRKAPAGYEYRLNGLCECPASDSDEVTCNVVTSGKYQAVLLSSTKCAPLPTGLSDGAIAGIVVGVLAAVLLMGLLWYCCRTPSTKEKNIEEGPVYVGRPVPLTPQQLAPSPMMIPMDYSAPLAAQGSPMMPTQLMEPLPNTYTPGSYPAQLMPMAGISGVPASPGLQQGTPMQYYVPASPVAFPAHRTRPNLPAELLWLQTNLRK